MRREGAGARAWTMPDTRKRVRISTDVPEGWPDRMGPHVYVDGEPLKGVTRVAFDYKYGESGPVEVSITLIGADIDLEAAPDYVVKVVGPSPPAKEPEPDPEHVEAVARTLYAVDYPHPPQISWGELDEPRQADYLERAKERVREFERQQEANAVSS